MQRRDQPLRVAPSPATPLLGRLIPPVAARLIAAEEELTALDREAGDGDHGSSMRRGCEAVLAQAERIAAKPLPEALKAIGNILMMNVGGASGPIYGTLFISLGRRLGQEPAARPPDGGLAPAWRDGATRPGCVNERDAFVAAFGHALTDVRVMGKSDVGSKTLLDVLVPVQRLLAGGGSDLVARARRCAAEAAASTVGMQALRGRASFRGVDSRGHMDPGARSSQLIVTAVCDELESAAAS